MSPRDPRSQRPKSAPAHRRARRQSSAMLLPQAASEALTRTGALVLLYDEELRLRYWNRACARSVVPEWDAVADSRPGETLFEGEDAERFEAALRDVQQGHDERLLETRWSRSAGPVARVAWCISALSEDTGGRRLVAAGLDVTERYAAEQALRLSEARYRGVMWQTTDVICLLDGQSGTILEANPAMHRLLGYELGALVGHRIHDVMAHRPESVDRNIRFIVRDGTRWLGERIYLSRDGQKIPAEIQVDTMDLAGQTVLCVVGRDLRPRKAQEAELRRHEEALRQAQRLESVGQLAAGVAHDFNNLLTTIIGYGGLLADSLDPEDPRREDVGAILTAGERGSSLVRQLLAFSRQQVLQPRMVDLNVAVHEGLNLLRRLLGEDVTLDVDLSTKLPAILADPGQVTQVLVNLAVNARDAMPEGGRLRIETETVELTGNDPRVGPDLEPGSYVRLRVQDTGAGMDPAVQERIFEPFFTTKANPEGTGLGLATVHGIVKQHQGAIDVWSAPRQGARFDVYLRAVRGDPTWEGPVSRARRLQTRGRTLLVVEDESTVLRYVTRTLEAAGYGIHAAESAEEALSLADRVGDEIVALFSDVVLPGMNGVDLAGTLRAKRPELPVLLTSGYAGDRARRERIAQQGYAFLPKPYDTRSLLDALDQILPEATPG